MIKSNQHGSIFFRTIALVWITFPITYPLLSFLALGLTTNDVFKILLGPGFWFVSFVAVIAGFGILRIRWYGWYAFLFSNFTIIWQNLVTLVFYSERTAESILFLVATVFQIVCIIFVGRDIRVPYFFPRIRWWESDPRYKLSIQTRVIREDRRQEEADIMDISMGGCFIKTMSTFHIDEMITLEFALFERQVSCIGRVMWATESTVTHPKGIGIKFENIEKETQAALKQATQKLKKLVKVYNQMSREKNWLDYLEREKKKSQNQQDE